MTFWLTSISVEVKDAIQKKPGEKSVKIYPIILLILKLKLEILKCVAKETCVVGIFLKKLNTLINEKNTNLKWETKKFNE